MAYQERKRRLRQTFKPRQEWWSRVFASPLASGILLLIADWRVVTPNRLTLGSLATALFACFLIPGAGEANLLIAAAAIQVSYVLDCMDGQLARYRQISTPVGAFADKWSDYVKFPALLLALTIAAFQRDPSITPLVCGVVSVFMVGYVPYVKSLAASELGISPSKALSKPDFVTRNLRLFLFEEAQWYLIVSACLAFGSPLAALLIMATTQTAVALVETLRIVVSLRR